MNKNQQLLNEAECYLKNCGDEEGVISQGCKARTNNTLRDLHNCADDMKAELNNCFIIQSKQFLVKTS